MHLTPRLLRRNSHVRLALPAPSAEQVLLAVQAALRAPDHAWLRPSRFLVLQAEQLEQLAEALVAATPDCTQQQADKFRSMMRRAPMVLVGIAHLTDHPKVPEVEQLHTVALALGYVQLVLDELGFASVWRTGDLAYNPQYRPALGLADNEKVVGFLYVGTAEGSKKPLPELHAQDFVRWQLPG